MKQRLNVNIDSEVYMLAKAARLNLSELINHLLLQYFEYQKDSAEESVILQALVEAKKSREEVSEKISQLSVQLVHAQEERVRKEVQNAEHAETMYRAARASGILEKVVGR